MIPEKNWKPMTDAPKDGTPIVVKFREWGKKDGPVRMQAAQWLPNENGLEWTWRKPYCFGTTVRAEAWMTYAELAAQEAAPAAVEYDL